MRLSLELMPRDTEIFVMLSLRVRFATLRQIARTWWLNGEEALEPSEQRLMRWETTGMLQRRARYCTPRRPFGRTTRAMVASTADA